MKSIFSFLFLSVFIASCCKHDKLPHDLCAEPANENNSCVTDTNQIKILITGKWNWTQSISSWTMEKTNPCSYTINRSYEFLNNGTVKYSENGNYKSTGTYAYQSRSIHAHDASSTFWLSGWVSICDNYLIIDDSPVDGAKDIFLKAE